MTNQTRSLGIFHNDC